MSCSGVDDPRSTELTPSFLRHHAGKSRALGSGLLVNLEASGTVMLL